MESDEQKPPWKSVDFCPGIGLQSRTLTPYQFEAWPSTELDSDLQIYKTKIALYEKYHVWELAKKMANPYECIYTQDETHFHPSLCLFRPLSRSFYKMIEILSVLQFFERLPKTTNKIRSAHVAEGPGGFIEALLERADKLKKTVSNVTAMTLKPTDSHTPGWRRASGFLQKHKEIILHYGIDGTGDMYQKGNQESFVEAAKPGVHLFTADGGFDFSLDYFLQEKRVFHLLICSALIGLQVLAQDGSFILKFFDISAKPTQILIAHITSCFKEWTVYKPVTSRPCNSERYLLCRGYRGVKKEVIEILTEMETQSLRDLYPVNMEVLTEGGAAFFKKNIEDTVVLQKNALGLAESFINDPSLWKEAFQSHFQRSIQWCSTFQMPFLQKRPLALTVEAVVSQMSLRAAALQSRRPDAESETPLPSDPASSALSGDCSCDTAHHSEPPPADSDNREKTQADAPLSDLP